MQNNSRLTTRSNNDLTAQILQLASGTKIEQRVQDALQKPNADIWDIYVCVVNNTAKDRRDDLYEFNSRIFESQLNSPTQPQEQLVQPQEYPAKQIIFQHAPEKRTQLRVQYFTQLETQPSPGKNSPRDPEEMKDGVMDQPTAKRPR